MALAGGGVSGAGRAAGAGQSVAESPDGGAAGAGLRPLCFPGDRVCCKSLSASLRPPPRVPPHQQGPGVRGGDSPGSSGINICQMNVTEVQPVQRHHRSQHQDPPSPQLICSLVQVSLTEERGGLDPYGSGLFPAASCSGGPQERPFAPLTLCFLICEWASIIPPIYLEVM